MKKSELIKKKIEKKKHELERLQLKEEQIKADKAKVAQDLANLKAEFLTALAVENNLSDDEVERRLTQPAYEGGGSHV